MSTSSHALAERSIVASTLSRLARVCREGENRLRHAADRSSDDALTRRLLDLARARARFAHELEIEAHVLGDAGRVAEGRALSRTSLARPQDDAERLASCLAGERSALVEYERALLSSLPEEIERILRSQHAAMKEASAELDALRCAS